MRDYLVYIMANGKDGTLYVGVTNDLVRRVYEHKDGRMPGFTRKYTVNQLVYFEDSDDITVAIAREKQLKAWKRAWKIKLIESENPRWRDLFNDIQG
jgi:putative endonuclease